MNSNSSKHFAVVSYALMGIVVFVYLALRAYYIPITHDEASNFMEYILQPYSHIFLGIPAWATNHIFHNLLVKISTSLFGNQVFFIRLPVLLSYPIYFFFCLKILQKLSAKPFWILVGLGMLNFHPYLLEFFSLSRGYGLSMALMMGSLYSALRYFSDYQNKHLIAAFTFAALAVYSNFAWSFYYASLFALFFLHTTGTALNFWKNRSASAKPTVALFSMGLVSLVLIALIFIPLKSLIDHKAFYIGGHTGFVSDTVGSLIRWDLYGQQYFGGFDLQILGGLTLLLLMAAFLWACMGAFWRNADISEKQKQPDFYALRLWVGLLGGMVLFSLVHIHFFGGKYAVGRAALFLFPSSILMVFTFLMCWQRFWVTSVFAFLLTAILLLHLLLTVNLQRSYEWSFDADTPAMMDFVQQKASSEQKTLSLGVHWLMYPSVHYYQHIHAFPNIEVHSDKILTANQYDCYYIHKQHADDYLKGYQILQDFNEKRVLLKRR